MDLYRTNNANDFQPTTQDPQSGVGTNLQTPSSSSLQPVPNSQGSQQNFPSTQRLQVLGVDNPSSSSRQAETPTAENGGLATGTIAGLLLLVVFAALLVWWAVKAYNDVDTFEPETEPTPEPIEEPQPKPAAAEASKTKTAKKKSTATKSKKAKKRRKKSK